MSTPNVHTITACEMKFDANDYGTKPDILASEVVARIQAAILAVPVEYRAKAVCRFDASKDYGRGIDDVTIKVQYTRPWTEAEVRKHNHRIEMAQTRREQDEHAYAITLARKHNLISPKEGT